MAATQHHHFLDDEDPPEYTPLPGAHEESLDAGAGAPIVRAQAAHLVINPSDPRSTYSRSYQSGSGSNASPRLPRRGNAASGPVPVNPRLPPRLNAGYERMEPAPHMSPRTHASLPHMRYTNSQQRTEPSYDPFLTLRNHPTSVRIINGLPALLSSRRNNACSSQTTVYATECPACRNSGWLSYKVPCECPVGTFVKSNNPRFHSSLLGFIDDLFGPAQHPHSTYPNSPSAPPHPPNSFNGGNGREPTYLQHVPGRGSPCPSCIGMSYFRNPNARDSPAARDVRGRLGRTPPPCNVCVDRGRIN